MVPCHRHVGVRDRISGNIVLCFPRIDIEQDHHHLLLITLSLATPLEPMGTYSATYDQRP